MTSSRPYIMRALYEWIVDNDCTPYVLVDANLPDVMVPEQYVKDGQIVLNISPTAVMDLNISNDAMAFNIQRLSRDEFALGEPYQGLTVRGKQSGVERDPVYASSGV